MSRGGIRAIGRGIEIIVIETTVATADQDQVGIRHQEIKIGIGREIGVMRGITIVSAKREIRQDAMVTLVIRINAEIESTIEVILMIDMVKPLRRPCPSHQSMIEKKESAFVLLVSTI